MHFEVVLVELHITHPLSFSLLKSWKVFSFKACPFMFHCIVSYFMDKIFSKMYIFNLSLELYQSFSTAWVYTWLYWSSPFCGKIKRNSYKTIMPEVMKWMGLDCEEPGLLTLTIINWLLSLSVQHYNITVWRFFQCSISLHNYYIYHLYREL